MFKNYIKTSWRSLSKHRSYSLINILGLTLGIASCLVIFLIVKYELGYDNFHKKAERIYRVTLNAIDFNPCVSMAVVPAMRNDFPELEQVSQVWYQQSGLVTVDQTKYTEKGFAFADQYFPAVFDYDWIEGSPKTALAEPNSIVLTESYAGKYFGSKEAMGKVIRLENQYNLKVTGIIKDLPGNTHLPFSFLVSFETVRKEKEMLGALSNFYWISGGSFAYIIVPANYHVSQIQNRIKGFIEKNWGKDVAREARLPLQPLTDIHFDQRYLNNTISSTTARETYYALAAIAILVIIIACINFIKMQPPNINKTLAAIDKISSGLFPESVFSYEFLDDHIAAWYSQEQKQYIAFKLFSVIAILIGCLGLYGLVAFAAAQRAKEVGIRKVLGASLSDIIYLFSKEFVLLIIIAFLIAAPVGYYVMNNWLQSFAYQVTIGPNIFVMAILSSFIIAAGTIAYQAIKAGVANPVKSLRTESMVIR